MKTMLCGINSNKRRILLVFILLLHTTVFGEIHRAKIYSSKNGGISHHQQHSSKRPTLSHGNSIGNSKVGERGQIGEVSPCELDGVGNQCNGRKSVTGGNDPTSSASFWETDEHMTNADIYVWINSLLCSSLVGLSGVLPLLVIPKEAGESLQGGTASNNLKLFLSFAVGGLLGDVFLHLLPEAWSHAKSFDDYLWTGEWALAGLLLFLFIEKIMSDESQSKELKEAEEKMHDCSGKGNRTPSKINHKEELNHNQNKDVALTKLSEPVQETRSIKISGYLNLLANIIDNFTHGLAVGGSFLVCNKVGIITTFAILVHEIPHEVGDFAILLRSGFDRWKAAKAQILTASGGLLGTITALSADSIEEAGMKTAWILPFTSGGFIYIALVSIVPELVEETEPKQSAKQIICIIAGIACMLLVTLIFE